MDQPQLYSIKLPEAALRQMLYWAREFSSNWNLGAPQRLHQRQLAEDGSPQWHPEFAGWLVEGQRSKTVPEEQRRTRKAFRHLRKVAPREFEVAYRFCVQGEDLRQIASWLNERAIRNGTAERYDRSAVLLILYSAIDKLRNYW